MAAVAQDLKPTIRINAPEALKPSRLRSETHTTVHSGVNHFGFSKKRENAAKAELERIEEEIKYRMSLPEKTVTPEQMKAELEAYIAAVRARSHGNACCTIAGGRRRCSRKLRKQRNRQSRRR
jgi:hypothetical protein